MTCASCVRAIEKAVTKAYGVENVSVSLPLDEVEIEFDATRIGTAEIISTIKNCGYGATLIRSQAG
jgi:P-type Cu+ transporter